MKRRRVITGIDPYFWQTRARDSERWEITPEHCQYVLDNAEDGFFYQQEDGRWNYRVYVPELGYVVRVILLADEETLYNAFKTEGG